jgi:hypothetical protein
MKHIRSIFAIAVILLAPAGLLAYQNGSSTETPNLSIRGTLRELTDDESARYAVSFYDLNGDRREEAIVYLTGQDWCGSGGCAILILERKNKSWSVISKTTLSRPPVRVLNSKHHGWRSLTVSVAGGGILRPYSAELDFNGKRYPFNPTVVPAKMVGSVGGEVVISEKTKMQALY